VWLFISAEKTTLIINNDITKTNQINPMKLQTAILLLLLLLKIWVKLKMFLLDCVIGALPDFLPG
jgi:hypothetical protein